VISDNHPPEVLKLQTTNLGFIMLLMAARQYAYIENTLKTVITYDGGKPMKWRRTSKSSR